MDIDQLSHLVIGAAIRVHNQLGPGLLESAYEACLSHELTKRKVRFERQKALPVFYDAVKVDCGYRVDLLVDDRLVVELKTVERFEAVHTAQLLTYLKLTGCTVGLLLNFNVPLMKQGVRRMVNGYSVEASRPLRPLR